MILGNKCIMACNDLQIVHAVLCWWGSVLPGAYAIDPAGLDVVMNMGARLQYIHSKALTPLVFYEFSKIYT